MGGSAEGSPRRLHRLGGVRTEPEATRGQRLWQGGTARSPGAADARCWLGCLSCGRCGRRLVVSYSGRPPGQPVYRCDRPNLMLGLPRCFTFGGLRVDAAIARELLRAVEPMAIEAAVEAERRYMEARSEQQRIVELELQQARYEASLAERRYAACDPDNRLIAAQLEKSWEAALRRVEACQARLEAVRTPDPAAAPPDFAGLARRSRGRMERARRDHARAPTAPPRPRHRHHRRRRRDGARGRPDDPLARRPALAIAGPQAEDPASMAAAPPKRPSP